MAGGRQAHQGLPGKYGTTNYVTRLTDRRKIKLCPGIGGNEG